MQTHNPTNSIVQDLYNYCENDKSGTLLLVTESNRSCQIIINRGFIVAVTMGRLKGTDALVELSKTRFKGASFNDNRMFPFKDEAKVSSNEEVFDHLGFSPEKSEPIETQIEETVELESSIELNMSPEPEKTSFSASEAQADEDLLNTLLDKKLESNDDCTDLMAQLEKEFSEV